MGLSCVVIGTFKGHTPQTMQEANYGILLLLPIESAYTAYDIFIVCICMLYIYILQLLIVHLLHILYNIYIYIYVYAAVCTYCIICIQEASYLLLTVYVDSNTINIQYNIKLIHIFFEVTF